MNKMNSRTMNLLNVYLNFRLYLLVSIFILSSISLPILHVTFLLILFFLSFYFSISISVYIAFHLLFIWCISFVCFICCFHLFTIHTVHDPLFLSSRFLYLLYLKVSIILIWFKRQVF